MEFLFVIYRVFFLYRFHFLVNTFGMRKIATITTTTATWNIWGQCQYENCNRLLIMELFLIAKCSSSIIAFIFITIIFIVFFQCLLTLFSYYNKSLAFTWNWCLYHNRIFFWYNLLPTLLRHVFEPLGKLDLFGK